MPACGTTPLAKKLQIKPGRSVAIGNAPEGFADLVGELPEGARIAKGLRGKSDVVIVFVKKLKELEKAESWKRAMNETNILWVCYPKLAAKTGSDLNRDAIHPVLEKKGLKTNAMCSIDDTWTGMRFKRV